MTASDAPVDLEGLAAGICALARGAAATILECRARGIATRAKDDASPVTDADEAANDLIVEGLAALTPDIPIVAEESVARGEVPTLTGRRFWLVDPLDGTKEFIAGRDEFTVNIALIEDARPVLAVVQLPPLDLLFLGIVGVGAWRQVGAGARAAIGARQTPAEGATVLASRSHFSEATNDWLRGVATASLRRAGSSYKFCLIAAGEADLYPRLGRTMEWDTAAGHGVLAAAGGSVRALDGAELAYGKPGFENPHFIARGA